MRRIALALAVGMGVAAAGCEDGDERMRKRQEALDKARAALKEKEAAGQPADKAAAGPTHPYWDDASFVVIRHEKACPEGMWALFPGRPPGGDDETRKANEARRKELADGLRGKTFVTRLRGPPEVKLGEFDAPKGNFPLELAGLVDCEDSIGRVTFGFTKPSPMEPKSSALEQGAQVVQSYWTAPPHNFTIPMKGFAEAKAFGQRHGLGIEGYVVFKLGATDVHRKLFKTPKVTRGQVTIGGTTDDYGAGRMVKGEVEGIRIQAHPGPVVVVDTREPSAVSLK